MRTKNSIILKSGGALFSGNGLHKTALKSNLRDHIKNEKAQSSVNNAVFGKVLGSKKDSDNVKIGSFGSGEHVPFVMPETDNIGDVLKKISFKEKKKRNNIVLEV